MDCRIQGIPHLLLNPMVFNSFVKEAIPSRKEVKYFTVKIFPKRVPKRNKLPKTTANERLLG
jgi:hypothetical protein